MQPMISTVRNTLETIAAHTRSMLIVAGLASLLITVPVAAAGSPYGSGTYNSGTYNNTSSGTASAPNTGAGLYSPGQTTTTSTRTINWAELAGGAALLLAGVGGFWILTVRKRRPHENDS